MDNNEETVEQEKNVTNEKDMSQFECNICFEPANEPVITLCGHLFCWKCIYKWISEFVQGASCPVCKSAVSKDKLIPLYCRGNSSDPRESIPDEDITNNVPERPRAIHSLPREQPQQYNNANPGFEFPMFHQQQFHHHNFSAGFGFFPGLFGMQFNFPAQGNRNNAPQQQQSSIMFAMGIFIILVLLLLD